MKINKTVLSMFAVGALTLTSLNANADSITLGSLSAVFHGTGSDWVYEYSFANSTVISGSYFTINDFGSASVELPPIAPAGNWVFSQNLVGPNSILGAVDNGSILNVTFTWNGPTIIVNPDATFQFTLHSDIASVSPQLHDYTTIDQSTTAGTSSRVIGQVRGPSTAVPDGGMTVAMLGLALSGLGLMRRKLVA